MLKRFVAPALADLRQDIAGAIPLNLIHDWTESAQDAAAQQRILAPNCGSGTLVSTDSSGLSRMCRQRPLIEVMKLVSQPKEIIHAYGKALGGEAIGTWVADNTEMFYDSSIEVHSVLEHMIAAQREIAGLELHIGIAIHSGEFVFLGGGAFGPEADIVEELAETFTCAGEIAVTSAARERLQPAFPGISFTDKGLAHMNAYRCDFSQADIDVTKSADKRYPFPFTDEVFDLLQRPDEFDTVEVRRAFSKYTSEAVVVLVKVHHEPSEFLLQQLTELVIAGAMIREIAQDERIRTIKSNGGLGIFLCPDSVKALDFARDLEAAFVANRYEYNIGLARGEVLVFPMNGRGGGNEIAGGPVNIASKIAEDVEEHNCIHVDDSVAGELRSIQGAERFRYSVSGIEIGGIRLR